MDNDDHWPGALAVLGAPGIYVDAELVGELPASMASLAAWAERQGVRAVWVHEGALGPLGLPQGLEGVRYGVRPHPWTDDADGWETGRHRGLAPSFRWWRRGGHGVLVNVPAWADDSPFAGGSALELGAAVSAYERATRGELPWIRTGGLTTERYLAGRYRASRTPLGPTALPIDHRTVREQPLQWWRRPTGEERRYPYAVGIDVNAAYPTAAGSIELPTGSAEHVVDPVVDERLPGVWLVEPGRFPREDLPAPWGRVNREGRAWVTTPTMAYVNRAYGVEPLEAWIWPEHHRYLRPWYELLRDARAELLDVGGPALAAVKQVGSRAAGRLASAQRETDLDADPLYQIYWAWAIVAEARARLHRKVAAFRGNFAVVAIHVDAVYCLAEGPELEGVELGRGMGQWKAAGVAPAAAVLEALDAEREQLDRVLRAFGSDVAPPTPIAQAPPDPGPLDEVALEWIRTVGIPAYGREGECWRAWRRDRRDARADTFHRAYLRAASPVARANACALEVAS